MNSDLFDTSMGLRTWRTDVDTGAYSALGRLLRTTTTYTSIRPDTITTATALLSKGAIKKVIFNDPATIVFWSNGDKTVVKCCENDVFDPEKGLAMAICKYVFGNGNYFHRVFKDWLPEEKDYDEMGARLFATDVGESIRKALSSIFPKNKEDDHHAEQ